MFFLWLLYSCASNVCKKVKKRDNFPLQIVGPMANDTAQLFGNYAATPDARFVQSPLEGLKGIANETRYAAGCGDTWCEEYDESEVKRAVTRAQLVVVCLGTGERPGGATW